MIFYLSQGYQLTSINNMTVFPEFEKGDLVRFYYIDYDKINSLYNILGYKGIIMEIYNKTTKSYWNIEFYSVEYKYLSKSKSNLVCYKSNVFDNMSIYKPIYYFRARDDFREDKKIIYKLTRNEADIINSYLKNKCYPKYFRLIFTNNKNITNDWEFFYNIFNNLRTHVEGGIYDRLDEIC